ncbi:uncharacterized protein LOC123525176 [Mercenaria mercenaria]|uniref:uncharacterized protein LOC123525176 n=1 Tax=Mercenaria mercenaria TaxID=6596 RepID=UPI00234F1F47|nr:uncharacterized protein LOC123525176 [Mercenaria mercenaria]
MLFSNDMSARDTDGEDTESQTTDTAAIRKPENYCKEGVHSGNQNNPPDKTTSGSEEHRVSGSITGAAKHTDVLKTPMSNLATISKEHRINETLTGAEKKCTKTDEIPHMSSEEHKFNESLKEAEEHYVYFWKKDDFFSQWHPSKFDLDNKKFCCAEQYMMYMKAVLLHDDKLAKKILSCQDPRRIKSLGRQTEQFSEDLWVHNCLHVVKEGNIAKYRQNERLKEILFRTYPFVLVEASPYDKVWGIGLSKSEPCAWNEATWEGKNLLGYILTEVRDELMCESGIIPESDKKVYFDKLTSDLRENSFGRKGRHDRTSRQQFTDKFSLDLHFNEDVSHRCKNKENEFTSRDEQHNEGQTENEVTVHQGDSTMEIHKKMPMDTELEQHEMGLEENRDKREDENALEQIDNTEEPATEKEMEIKGIENEREEEKAVSGEETDLHIKSSKENEDDLNAHAITIKDETKSFTDMPPEKSRKENEDNMNAIAATIKDETKLFTDMSPDLGGQKGQTYKKNKNEQLRRIKTAEADANYRCSRTEQMNPQERLYKPEYKSSKEKSETEILQHV